MLETYMIYFIPILCIHNNLLNTFKSENGSLFYFILCLLYLNYVLKKILCTQNNLSNTLKYENVLLLFFSFTFKIWMQSEYRTEMNALPFETK